MIICIIVMIIIIIVIIIISSSSSSSSSMIINPQEHAEPEHTRRRPRSTPGVSEAGPDKD